MIDTSKLADKKLITKLVPFRDVEVGTIMLCGDVFWKKVSPYVIDSTRPFHPPRLVEVNAESWRMDFNAVCRILPDDVVIVYDR